MASSSRLEPGEKGAITVKIDTSSDSGYLLKTVIVFTNEPRSRLALNLTAEVKNNRRK